jgi:hypothetical protein
MRLARCMLARRLDTRPGWLFRLNVDGLDGLAATRSTFRRTWRVPHEPCASSAGVHLTILLRADEKKFGVMVFARV